MYKYNPKRVTGSLMNIAFEGLMDGVFITVEKVEKAVLTHVGGSGELSAVLNANTLAKATLTFVQGSPTNDAFSKKVPNAAKNFFPTGVFQLNDLNGNTVVNSKDAFIEDFAKIDFGKEITGRQWTIYLPEADITAGGAGS